jgi:uncharacterized protein (TIGR02391 family)
MKAKNKKKKSQKKRVLQKRSTSAKKIQDIRLFAEKIGEIIPATSQGDFSFLGIAQSKKMEKYWLYNKSKKDQLSYFFTKLYKYHPNVFKKIIRENIPQGIERRFKQGNPVLNSEMIEIDEILLRLNINLSKEFRQLELPDERPKIVPPPATLQNMIDKVGLHPKLQAECAKKFKDGHLNDAVRDACEKLENYVQVKSGRPEFGKDLMAKVFNDNSPIIPLIDVSSKRGQGIQEGFMFLMMGTISNIRNKFSHGDEAEIKPHDAYYLLCFISYLFYQIP